MTDIVIRPVQPGMLDTLVQLEQQTYTETFGPVYQAADLNAFLQEKKSLATLQQELAQPGALYYILYYGNTPAGFLKLNLGKQPDDAARTLLPTPVMELEKIYVLQSLQGHKLGKALMQQAYAVAQEHGIKTLWLGVWEHNTRAFNFYRREGFEHFSEHSFRVGTQKDTDWLMKKQLY
ncbi:GNAT family N-acetyltransferase [Chitinophaga japonensis]|uniref:Acetyltransferase (GNAT) family protein n=1 Tax=Chitinophaga japonensis TaxID=104662 RepID=A0A562TCZ4_CHIJA|nr:GNAT family N-acetyltransferase [Chitinophaga japonensis]TWI91389.1 acetyltransferase (GNAT) family protein [Chitinophaga japonensis]